MSIVRIRCGDTVAEVDTVAAMTTAEFACRGRRVAPLYTRPWRESDASDVLLQNLKGDFFCLPFGGDPPSDLDPSWRARGDFGVPYPHGYSANAEWTVTEWAEDRVRLRLDYNRYGIEYVEREVRVFVNRIEFEDVVCASREVKLPVGIHPIFALGEEVGSARLVPPVCAFFATYPGTVDASSVLAPNREFASLACAPRKDGGYEDCTLLPLAFPAEEVVFAGDVVRGEVALERADEGYRVVLDWDRQAYPNCLFWISNRGRAFAPWNGRNLCLGVEPVDSAFDLGTDICVSDNPFAKRGISTAHTFGVGRTVLRHGISLKELD